MKQQQHIGSGSQTASPQNTMMVNMNLQNIHQNTQLQHSQSVTMDERAKQINEIRQSGILPQSTGAVLNLPQTRMLKSASAPVSQFHASSIRQVQPISMTASHTPEQSWRQSAAHIPQNRQHTTIVYGSAIDPNEQNHVDHDMINDNDNGQYMDDNDDDYSDDDGKNINDLLEGDAVLAGDYVGIIKYLGPLYLDPFNTQKITEEQYIGIECSSESDVAGKGHDGWYKEFRYFKTKHGKKTGILIEASEFTKKLTPWKLLQTIKKLKNHTKIEILKRQNKLLSFPFSVLFCLSHFV